MVSTFTSNKHIEQPANNDDVNVWDVPVNGNMTIIDKALGGSKLLNATALSGTVVLAVADYQPLSLLISGAPSAAVTYSVPSGVGGFWIVENKTTGGFTISLISAAGGSAIPIPANTATLISCDGSATGMRLGISTPPPAAGSTTQIQFNNSGVLGGSANLTWNGTTLSTTGLSVTGNTVLGDAAGDTLQINGTAIGIPNGVNIGSGLLQLSTIAIGIGLAPGTSLLTVGGLIESTSGGIKFPDGSIQASASAPTVPGGSTTQVQYNLAGAFAGNAALTFDAGTGVLTTKAALDTASTAVTQAPGDNTTKVATDAFVTAAAAAAITAAIAAGAVQVARTITGAVNTGSTVLPVDNSKPQNNEGDEYMTVAITPRSATNLLVIDVTVFGSHNLGSANNLSAALFQDALPDALRAGFVASSAQNEGGEISFKWVMLAGTTSSTTFKVRAGPSLPSVFTFNGSAGTGIFDGVMGSSIIVTEYPQP